jgi:hypothetical protein
MQQMQGPEERTYGEGYQVKAEYPAYEAQPGYPEQAEQPRQPYGQGEAPRQSYEQTRFYQQKLQPANKTDLARRGIAIAHLVISSIALGFAIAVFVVATVLFAKLSPIMGAQGEIFELSTAAFVVSLFVLILSIAGFVFALIQVILSVRGVPRH